ncbi:Hint domain-containing protein [Limimaricola sp.]|uniref:Hint domain-containing protein n=1 Tax=Limimaricola sp. TaxID=2211665 RepID=UPI0025C2067F|nr:Hint domain-containing protein [Limimaricola sp.]
MSRRYGLSFLGEDGTLQETTLVAPALPAFEAAVSAFARGTIFRTVQGETAIEDLWPGDEIITEDGPRQLLWRGTTRMTADAPGQRPQMGRLVRVLPDDPDAAQHHTVLGPAARIFVRRAAAHRSDTAQGVLVPVTDLLDGVNIVEVAPPGPVEVFHLAFADHVLLRASGVVSESYHPGPLSKLDLGHDLRRQWLSMFPHLSDPAGFGPLRLPRLALAELNFGSVA